MKMDVHITILVVVYTTYFTDIYEQMKEFGNA